MKVVVQRSKNSNVIVNGKIIETGSYELAREIEKTGYNEYLNKSNIIIGE